MSWVPPYNGNYSSHWWRPLGRWSLYLLQTAPPSILRSPIQAKRIHTVQGGIDHGEGQFSEKENEIQCYYLALCVHQLVEPCRRGDGGGDGVQRVNCTMYIRKHKWRWTGTAHRKWVQERLWITLLLFYLLWYYSYCLLEVGRSCQDFLYRSCLWV